MYKAMTFGYTGKKIEHLQEAVAKTGATVMDCRFSPRSRNKAWGQSNLIMKLKDQYVWCQEFGNLNYKGGPTKLKDPAKGIERALAFNSNIILLCMCADFNRCHTKEVLEILKGHFETYDTFDIFKNLEEDTDVEEEEIQTTF